jgi:heptaprenylglyceryl phosphate synthase
MNSKFRSKGIVPESRLSDPDILDILNEPYSLESLRKEAENMIDYNLLTASQKRYVDKLQRDQAIKNKKTDEEEILEKFEQGRIRNLPKGQL